MAAADSPETAARRVDADGVGGIRERVRGTNINEKSLLATDYLNHFNKIVMVLEMIPDMPNCLEDAKAWCPKSYTDHFRDSGFSDSELAIAAYDHAPPDYREMFDGTVEHMDRLVALSIDRISAAPAIGERDAIERATSRATRDLKVAYGCRQRDHPRHQADHQPGRNRRSARRVAAALPQCMPTPAIVACAPPC